MNKKFFNNKVILITGGTGSFGKALVQHLLDKKYPLRKIIIFSRDELKQSNFQNNLHPKYTKLLRFFIGDVRDYERLRTAFEDVDYVIHAAALKQVPAAEYNPIEFIKTNVLGTQNIISSCLEKKIKAAILLSTDKASSPINLYGATKLCADKLFLSANNIKGKNNIKFSVVRYGNVMGSRGSVIENFIRQKKNGKLYLTDPKMTRFNMLIEEAVDLVLWTLEKSIGGELIIPKIPSFNVKDLAKAIGGNTKLEISGIRPGEKIHEEMISIYDSPNTLEFEKFYMILPNHLLKSYKNKGKAVKKNFVYNSLNNKKFLTISQLKKEIKKMGFNI
jgi:UDP-N-acetylglucosamine 4,6-dehydratase/5-epimerase